ncbi:unnamed protein product [Euphydryas editha]|uniref:Uncharacterized protein n=1 Tax=Euphydryas editha TaxID=104508 RepID=A0AAU9UMW4_EUPED|nr:unnamed protein product [Euphydryas editha]
MSFVSQTVAGLSQTRREEPPPRQHCSHQHAHRNALCRKNSLPEWDPPEPRARKNSLPTDIHHKTEASHTGSSPILEEERSEFLGCVSFPLKDAIKNDISGTYFLQQGRQSAPAQDACRVTERRKMATDNTETSTNDGAKENTDKGVASNGPSTNQAQAALQREADEHLFLRYLELDPPEDPAAPRRTQRHGRTPFTTTRKLLRGTTGGFGFTVVWTRPPRVERVAAGGSAERAGLRAGDYIVFVGNKNVVTASEEEVRNLVKSAGQNLNLETFRRVPQNGAGIKPRLGQVSIPAPESTPPPAPKSPRAAALASPAAAARPPTACSSTSQSLDRRKLHLPQVTFSKEATSLSADGRKRALLAVVAREQHYGTCLQFGLVRFVSPLAERADLIAPSDHQLLFQNIEEIFRLSEDILDQVVQDDGEIQTSTVVAVYLQKTPIFISLYKKYCLGLKRADCVLVKKSKDPSGAFSRFCTSPPIPRRRPDITSLVHKPLEQFRELLRLMRAAAICSGAGPYDQLEKKQLQIIVEQLQCGYQDVTAGSGLMGLAGDGKPLLSVADLESRLVFTRCKPFVLSTPGRQWIFGGELSRVEGRTIRPYWALLFSDLLLFATVSRDRVLFVTEEPVALGTVSEAQFNIRKKATEFRLILGRPGGESPQVSCAPRTPARSRPIVLRAPSIDLKAVWQSLLQRQIYRAHTMSGTPLGSPLDSPDPQLTFSLATLDSQQRQVSGSSIQRHSSLALLPASSYRSHLNMLIEERPEKEVRVSFNVRPNSASPQPQPVRGPLSTVWRTAPTPETPSANLSPADSQTFSSHFVSSSSIERNDAPASPSAQLTSEGGDEYSEVSPCRWESFEADLALADLDVDPSYKHAVEERIFLPDDPLLPRVPLPERPTPPAYLEL